MSTLPAKNRFTVIPAVYLILEKDGKYLFLKRQNTGYMDGYYQVPAGHLEGGENLKQAMVREAKEEIDLDLLEKDLELVFVAHKLVENAVERMDFYFTVKNFVADKIRNNETEKCSDLAWLTLESPEIVPVVKQVLCEYQKGNNYDSFGFDEEN